MSLPKISQSPYNFTHLAVKEATGHSFAPVLLTQPTSLTLPAFL